MPKGTRVHRCVDKMKKKGGSANPYAVCQSATGQSYATGKSLRSNMPDGASLSPRGDLGMQRVMEAQKARMTVHNDGSYDVSSHYLPFRRVAMEGDTAGLSVREVPKDSVV